MLWCDQHAQINVTGLFLTYRQRFTLKAELNAFKEYKNSPTETLLLLLLVGLLPSYQHARVSHGRLRSDIVRAATLR